MDKKTIVSILIVLMALIVVATLIFILNSNKQGNDLDVQINHFDKNYDLTNTWANNNKNEELSKEEVSEKIDGLKKKLALKWLIAKWDTYFKQEEYTIALTKFLQILKELPGDKEIINKIWDIYFELKKYDKAYNYYLQIKDYTNLDIEKTISALVFSYNDKFNIETIDFIKKEINKYNLTTKELFYYQNSLSCIEDFHICKQNFQDFFAEVKSNTWTLDSDSEEQIETYQNLTNIEDAIINYKNFKLNDLWYKNALISWAFFTNWLYPIAIETSKKTLIEKPNYKPILKILAKSYYELWYYNEAKDFLIQYNKVDDKDAEVSYFLWVIYQKLHDYILSSIHLKKSINLWYINETEARRRMIFNYSEVWEIDKMLSSLNELIKNEKEVLELEDFNLAIYFHIINKKYDIAKQIANKWIEDFEENAIFYWYLWWIWLEWDLLIEWNIELIEKNLDTAYKLDNHNSMINYLLWMLELEKNNSKKAIDFLKMSINIDEKWEFWIRSKELLNIINNKEKWA